MASPPFDINALVPEDDDIVSQYPLTERTFRDIVESWLLVGHNTQGRHKPLALDNSADPSGIANVTQIWPGTTSGALRYRIGTGDAEYLLPPGIIVPYAGSTAPVGWSLCDGSTLSRTTFSLLFAAIGTSFGSGDGSTTFHKPNLKGRIPVGKDDMGGSAAGLVTSTTFSPNGTTLGAVGGAQVITLASSEVPATAVTVVITDPGHAHVISNISFTIAGDSGQARWNQTGGSTRNTDAATTGITAAGTVQGGGGAHNNMPPGLIVNYIIKL